MARRFIPKGLEDITPAWLTQALTSSGVLQNASVRGLKIDPVGSEQGYMGILARLSVEYDPPEADAPATMIVKFPTQQLKNKITGEIFLNYERENRLYEETLPKLPLRTPRCYFSDMDSGVSEGFVNFTYSMYEKLPKALLNLYLGFFALLTMVMKRRYILLLEDFGNLEAIDQRQGCSFEDAKLVMKPLGKNQAACWQSPMVDRYWLKPHSEVSKLMGLLYERGLPVINRNFSDKLTQKENDVFNWLLKNNARVDDYVKTRPTTLVHSDFRVDNIFFDRANNEIAVIDWQTCYRGLGVADAAYFCLHGGSRPFTRAEVAELLAVYHAGLVQGGVSDYSLVECLSDFKYGLMVALRYVMIILGTLEIDKDPNVKVLANLWLDRMKPLVESIDLTAF